MEVKVLSEFLPSRDSKLDLMLANARRDDCLKLFEGEIAKIATNNTDVRVTMDVVFDPLREGIQVIAVVVAK